MHASSVTFRASPLNISMHLHSCLLPLKGTMQQQYAKACGVRHPSLPGHNEGPVSTQSFTSVHPRGSSTRNFGSGTRCWSPTVGGADGKGQPAARDNGGQIARTIVTATHQHAGTCSTCCVHPNYSKVGLRTELIRCCRTYIAA